MYFKNIPTNNVRIILVDELDADLNDCLIEIKIRKSLLNNFAVMPSNFNQQNTISVTKRELEVLKQLAKGLNNTQISNKLNISLHTTKAHIRSIFSKLSVQDRTEAVVVAIKDKLINVLQL